MKEIISPVRKILVVNLAFIGDVILSTPVVRGLWRRWPEAKIHMVTIPVAAPVAAMNPYLEKVWIYDKRSREKKWQKTWQLIADLRQEKYDLAVATNFSLRSAVLAWASGSRYRAGYDVQQGGWFLTHKAKVCRDGTRHETVNQLDVLQSMGIWEPDSRLELAVDAKDKTRIQEQLAEYVGMPKIVLCPAGSYSRKSWQVSGYAALVRELSSRALVCLIGGRQEESLLREIHQGAGGQGLIFAGTLSLGEVAALLEEASLLISVDTGPLHMAQGVGTPVLGLYGPTDPAIWGPRGEQDRIIYTPVECSPCWGKGECLSHICMDNWTVEQVLKEAQAMLAGK